MLLKIQIILIGFHKTFLSCPPYWKIADDIHLSDLLLLILGTNKVLNLNFTVISILVYEVPIVAHLK